MKDLYEIAHSAGRPEPLWYDENGCPRWADHHPKHCPDIYADEVVLLLIACQACDQEFRVQMSWGTRDALNAFMIVSRDRDFLRAFAIAEKRRGTHADEAEILAMEQMKKLATALLTHTDPKDEPTMERRALAAQIRSGVIHYGDPPNTGCCPAGPTMNCMDLRVLEYWERGSEHPTTMSLADAIDKHEWRRVADLERVLPDGIGAGK